MWLKASEEIAGNDTGVTARAGQVEFLSLSLS